MSEDSTPSTGDVRMRGFARRTTVKDALNWIDAQTHVNAAESIRSCSAAGRVLAQDVVSNCDVPGFPRAMMDGHALRAADTSGASDYNPLTLHVVGQTLPGQCPPGPLKSGQAIRIMTGAPLPVGADAVLPAEKSQSDGERLQVLTELPPGKHVGRKGEDVSRGTTILAAGRRLRPQDLGLLAAVGMARVDVVRKVRVQIVVTGSELLPPGSRPEGFRIVDSNSPMLGALVNRDGGVVINSDIVPDNPQSVFQAMSADVDVVLVSGGTSVGMEDHAPQLLSQHGDLAIHGIAMRPSSPSGMGRLGHRLVFLLPGNPVSCLCAYDFFAGRAIRATAGLDRHWPYATACLPLERKLVSTVGRVDYARVAIRAGRIEPIAISGASVLSSTTRADGFVVVPADSEGYPANTQIRVYLYD